MKKKPAKRKSKKQVVSKSDMRKIQSIRDTIDLLEILLLELEKKNGIKHPNYMEPVV